MKSLLTALAFLLTMNASSASAPIEYYFGWNTDRRVIREENDANISTHAVGVQINQDFREREKGVKVLATSLPPYPVDYLNINLEGNCTLEAEYDKDGNFVKFISEKPSSPGFLEGSKAAAELLRFKRGDDKARENLRVRIVYTFVYYESVNK